MKKILLTIFTLGIYNLLQKRKNSGETTPTPNNMATPVATSMASSEPAQAVANENPVSNTMPSDFAPTQPTSPAPVANADIVAPSSPVSNEVASAPTDGVVAQQPEVMPSPNTATSEIPTTEPSNPTQTPPTNPVV